MKESHYTGTNTLQSEQNFQLAILSIAGAPVSLAEIAVGVTLYAGRTAIGKIVTIAGVKVVQRLDGSIIKSGSRELDNLALSKKLDDMTPSNNGVKVGSDTPPTKPDLSNTTSVKTSTIDGPKTAANDNYIDPNVVELPKPKNAQQLDVNGNSLQGTGTDGISASSTTVASQGSGTKTIVQGKGSASSNVDGHYEPNPKHNNPKGNISPQPTNPKSVLESSFPVGGNSKSRIGYDASTGEIVVFQNHLGTAYHGYVPKWADLTQRQKNVLIKAGIFKPNGKLK